MEEDAKQSEEEEGQRLPEEKRLHRRRCCCCVLWWLTALLLIILTLVLFMVFWTRYRGSNLPDINFDEYENIPSCHGTWRKTFILCNSSTRPNVTYQCCYGVDALKAVSGHGDAWPGGWTFDGPCTGCKTCNAAFPKNPVCSAPTHQLSSCVLFGMAWIVFNQIMENYVHG